MFLHVESFAKSNRSGYFTLQKRRKLRWQDSSILQRLLVNWPLFQTRFSTVNLRSSHFPLQLSPNPSHLPQKLEELQRCSFSSLFIFPPSSSASSCCIASRWKTCIAHFVRLLHFPLFVTSTPQDVEWHGSASVAMVVRKRLALFSDHTFSKKYEIQVRWLRDVCLVMASRADCLMLLPGLAALDDDSSCHVAQASHVEQSRGCSNARMVLGSLLL